MSIDVTSPSVRVASIAALSGRTAVAAKLDNLTILALRGLPQLYRAPTQTFAHTGRGRTGATAGLGAEGINLRYTAIAALGLAQLDIAQQQDLLAGHTVAQLTETLAAGSLATPDLGSAALAAWTSAETNGAIPEALVGRLVAEIENADAARPTVDFAWTVTALIAAHNLSGLREIADRAVNRLLESQGASGLFPHALPRTSLGRYRSHIGCYADQVYPIQALARHFAVTGDKRALQAANDCANRITDLQGPAGQWWWHYDVRTGDVVERYPVYSVHQHAMGPMALFDLYEANGDDHRSSIAAGLSWLDKHPETSNALCDDESGAIWRKVGRREPRKAVRSIRAVSTSLSPRLKLRFLDLICKPGPIDYECRPYELGWLLYAWFSQPIAALQAMLPVEKR